MEREKVKSSNLESVGYDEDKSLLEVEFKDGAVYQYSGVSSELHKQLISADSVGSFFQKNIRDWPTTKVN